MAEDGAGAIDMSAIQVCVRVRPINDRERTEGHRTCVSFDEPSRQVVLTAVDKSTLLQLRGAAAKGYAFDRRYAQDSSSDDIYEDTVQQLVESCFKGYNATVLAYGQTGSGKTHTMSGGTGIHGRHEEGITPRVIRHVFNIADLLNKKAKPGEKIQVSAYALELYNEDLLDLSVRSGRGDDPNKAWDGKSAGGGLKLQERPTGKEGRVVPEVVGIREIKVFNCEDLGKFYDDCMDNRSTSRTNLNDRSSRSHAIFTIIVNRTMIEVTEQLDEGFKAKVRTQEFSSKLHLVDLAGSERVKRSGVTGKELKEATHINSGLLALGNVITALSDEALHKKKGHIPYRDSKLTRLLQDSLGGNSLTVLISCISPSEMDFEETNNTLKYANRACSIKNTPLPNKYTSLEEDLLPSVPMAGGLGMVQLQALLEDHEKLKEFRERKDKEKKEKEARKLAALVSMRDDQVKKPGYQRLRASQYDELRRQLASRGATNIPQGALIGEEILTSFGKCTKLTQSVDLTPSPGFGMRSLRGPISTRMRTPIEGTPARGARSMLNLGSKSVNAASKPNNSSFLDWLDTQQEGDGSGSPGFDQDAGADLRDLILDEGEELASHLAEDSQIIQDEEGGDLEPETHTPAQVIKNKFRRGPAAALREDAAAELAHSASAGSGLAGSLDVQVGGSDLSTTLAVDGLGDTPELGPEADPDEEVEEVDEPMDADEDLGELGEDDPEEVFDPIQDDATPKLLARFKVNTTDTLAVFKAVSKEDFKDVVGLLPENTPLPASDKMTYLLARLEVDGGKDSEAALARVASGQASMNEAVGPAVGCLMATFGTNMISSCIFEFPDPEELVHFQVDERIELWGLQIPHNSVRPQLVEGEQQDETPSNVITWTSVDRLNMSIGLLYALCCHAKINDIKCGCCVPRPQLLKRWLQAGVRMKQIQGPLQLIYPPSAHDYEYYKASTVAYFMVQEVLDALQKVLAIES